MTSLNRQFDSLKAYHHLLTTNATDGHTVAFAKDDELRLQAQLLHATVYRQRGYIRENELAPDGRISHEVDPYHRHSLYFIVLRRDEHGHEKVVATARQINALSEKGHASFPTIEHLDLYPKALTALHKLDPEGCVEISALAKQRGASTIAPLMLYRLMWQYSIKKGHHTWVLACDTNVYKRLKLLFGETFDQIGDETFYLGSDVVPAKIQIDKSIDAIFSGLRSRNPAKRAVQRYLVPFMLDGLPPEYFNAEHTKILQELKANTKVG